MAKRGKGKGYGGAPADYWERQKSERADFLKRRPKLGTYLERVGAVVVGFHKAEVRADSEPNYGHVARVLATIRFGGGKLTWDNDELCAVDDAEKASIEAEIQDIAKAKTVPVDDIDGAPFAGHDPNLIYIYRDLAGRIAFVQVRAFNADDDKHDFPWTLWQLPGGKPIWRMMEPDGLLPLFYSDRTAVRHRPKHPPRYYGIMVHEGAKTAKYCAWLQSDDPDARAALGTLPADWAERVRTHLHIGWPAGAPNPHKVDWSPLRDDPRRLILVLDNDPIGKDAAPKIAKLLMRSMEVIRFDQRFPETFDLSDPFPEADAKGGASWWVTKDGKRLWRGPRLADYIYPATWATKLKPVQDAATAGRPSYTVRREFHEGWLYSVQPALFVNKRMVQRQYSADDFNSLVRPFSDVEDVARLLRRDGYSAQADGVTYQPGGPAGDINVDGSRLINLHRPTMIEPVKGDPGPWLDYLAYLVPADNERWELMRWCATLIAAPSVRIEYSLLLLSETQGVGKTTLGESILAPLVGWWNTSVPTEKEVVEGSFNSWQAKVRLILIHEIYAGHNRKAYDRLKSVVTEKVVQINEKFVKQYELPNHAVVFASSNSLFALFMDDKDRRWLVAHAAEEIKGGGWWREFHDWLKSDGLGIILQWAKDFVAEHGAIGSGERAPETVAKSALINETRSPGAKLAFELGEKAVELGAPASRLVFRNTETGARRALPLNGGSTRRDALIDPTALDLQRGVKYEFSVVTSEPEKVALVVNTEVREWVARKRGFIKWKTEEGDLTADKLETPLTLRKALLAAGMTDPARKPGADRETRYMIDGASQSVVFNFEVKAGESWDALSLYKKTPEEVFELIEKRAGPGSPPPRSDPSEPPPEARETPPGGRPGGGRKGRKVDRSPM